MNNSKNNSLYYQFYCEGSYHYNEHYEISFKIF